MGIVNKEGALFWATGIDNSGLYRDAKQAEGVIDRLGNYAKRAGYAIGSMFAVTGVSSFLAQMVQVHGEMQQLNIAFTTMLKSQEKADALMSGLKTFATDTPFGLMDSAKGAKQLLAYGTQAENIVGDLKMLGNVASGVSAPLGDIVYLYGTLRSQGRAYAVDIRQFAGRGIPIYAELAKVLKVNVDQVNDLVSAGKVGFSEVEQAFKNMTTAGGMFEGLMEKQTASVTGQIEKLKDNVQFMFDAIGTSSEGVIYSAIDGASSLVENYETVGKILLGLITTYGAYRTAMLLTTTVENARMAVMEKALTTESLENISKQNLTKGTIAYAAAVQAELVVQQKKELAALKEIGFEARRNYVKEQSLLLSAQQAVIDAKATGVSASKITALQAEASARGKSVIAAKAEMVTAAQNIATKQADIVATATSTTSTNLLTIAKTKLAAAATKLNVVLMNNTYAILGAAAVALAYGIYQAVTATTKLEESQKRVQKATEDFNASAENERLKLDLLFDRFKNAKKGTDEYKKAKDDIMSLAESYQTGLSKEIDLLNDIAGAYKAISAAALQSAKDRAIAKGTQSAIDTYTEQWGKSTSKIQKEFISKFGKERGTLLLDSLKDSLSNGKELSKEVESAIKSFDKIMYSAQGAASTTQSYQYNPINLAIGDIRESKKILDQERNDLIGVFGTGTSANNKEKDTIISNYNDQLKDAQDNVSKLKKDLANLRKGIRPVDIKADVQFDFAQNIEEKSKELKDAQDKLSRLTTGQSYSASNRATNAEETAAQKAIKLAQDQADRELKIENDKIKSKFDLRSQQLENEEKYLNNQQDSFDKQQQQNELNYKKESLALEKHIQDLVETAQKTERDEWDKKNPKGSKTPFKTKINSLSDLSVDQQTASIQSDSLNNEAYAKATADTLKSLLNLYQDYNERKRAINEKYDQDLVSLEKSSSQARTEQEKAQIESAIVELKKRWAEALSSVNIDELKESINWEKVFGDLDKVSTQELAKLRDKLKEYLSSVGGSPQDLKTVTDAFNNLNDKLSQKRPVNELKTSYEEYRKTLEKVAEAKEKLAKLEKGTPAYLKAEKDLVDAQNENESARVKFAKGIGNTVNKISEYLEAANALVSTLETMGIAISDSTKQALEGFGQILDGASKLAEGYAEKNPTKMIQGAITQIQGYYNAVIGLFGSGKTLTQKQIDAYKDLLSVLDDVIARQKELLQNSSAKESSKYYQDALDTIEKQREAAKKFLTDDFFESKEHKTGRTYGARERRYIQQDDNQAKLKALGIELKNQYDLLNLTKDEILLIQQKMPEFYANLFDETKDYLQLIVDTEDQTKELGEALQEALTGISFDSLKDSLDSLVQSADTTFSDISDSFEDHMRNAVLNFVKSSYLTAALQDWYNKFAEYAQSGSTDDSFGLTPEETAELKKMYEEAYNKAQGLYDSAIDAMGVSKGSSSSSQSSSYGASTSMDQETGGLMVGRLTGIHETSINIEGNTLEIILLMSKMNQLGGNNNQELQAIKNSVVQSTFYLEEIRDSNNELYEIKDLLMEIKKNTNAFKGK